MEYINEFYVKPIKETFLEWKKLLLSIVIEVLFVALIFSALVFGVSSLLNSAQPLIDNEIDNQEKVMENLFLYESEMKDFVQGYYIYTVSIGIFLFIIFTMSRTFIWSKLLKLKSNIKLYLKNSLMDLVLCLLVSFLYWFIVKFVNENIQPSLLYFGIAISIYYSFLVRLNVKKSLLNRFKINLKNALLFLPHSLIFLMLSVFLFNQSWGLLPLLLLFCIYRIMIVQINKLVLED